MNILLSLPVEVSAQLVGGWLTVPEMCKLEVAMCSPTLRTSLTDIYQCTAAECYICKLPNITESHLDWIAARNMKIFNLCICSQLDESVIQKVIVLLKRSTSLVHTFEAQNNKKLLDSLVVGIDTNCRCLVRVQFVYCTLTESCWQLLNHSHSLRELLIEDCTVLDDIRSNYPKVMLPSVQRLWFGGDADQGIENVLHAACSGATFYNRMYGIGLDLSTVPGSLTELHIDACDEIHIESSAHLPPGLTTLRVSGSTVNDEHLEPFFTQCHNLTTIVLAEVVLSGKTIKKVADTYGSKLEVLSLRGYWEMKLSSLEYLCSKCITLTSLDISNNKHLPDSVYGLVLDNVPALKEFKVNAMDISDTAMRRIAQSSLESLAICDTAGYSASGLFAIADGCLNLKVIYLNSAFFTALVKLFWLRQRPNLRFNTELTISA